MLAEVKPFPLSGILDVPGGLRKLADEIEAGKWGDAHNLAYAIDGGDGMIGVGMLGQSTREPGTEAHLLYSIACQRLEGVR